MIVLLYWPVDLLNTACCRHSCDWCTLISQSQVGFFPVEGLLVVPAARTACRIRLLLFIGRWSRGQRTGGWSIPPSCWVSCDPLLQDNFCWSEQSRCCPTENAHWVFQWSCISSIYGDIALHLPITISKMFQCGARYRVVGWLCGTETDLFGKNIIIADFPTSSAPTELMSCP